MPITMMVPSTEPHDYSKPMSLWQSTLPSRISSYTVAENGQHYLGPYDRPCNDETDRLYFRVSHVGQVLSLGERNGYHDSDFYAMVWDAEKGQPGYVEYASTRGWSYPNHAEVDATPEVLAAFRAWQENQARAARKAEEERQAATPAKGKVLRVVRGRKVPQGTEGVCVWYGAAGKFCRCTFRCSHKAGMRVGIKVDGAEKAVFTDANNVEVVR
jgi:hypothetical protein